MKISGYRSIPIQTIKGKTIELDGLFESMTQIETKSVQLPKGYHTTFEYAEMFQVSERTIQRRIKSLWRSGIKIDIKFGFEKNILGNSIKVPYYKIDKGDLLR